MKPLHKFNGGLGATLCNNCSLIIHTGLSKTLFCKRCDPIRKELHNTILVVFNYPNDKEEESNYDHIYFYLKGKKIIDYSNWWAKDMKTEATGYLRCLQDLYPDAEVKRLKIYNDYDSTSIL